MAPSPRLPLRAYLDDVLATSNRLVADLCEPVERLGLSRAEHLVLLMLWDTDGMPEAALGERLRLPGTLVAPALQSLQDKALVERGAFDGAADVWLTRDGRRAQQQAGRDEMCSRLRVFERDIAGLHAKLQRALDLVGEEMAGSGSEEGRA